MAVILFIFIILLRVALAIIRIIVGGLYIVARCIVLTAKNAIEDYRLGRNGAKPSERNTHPNKVRREEMQATPRAKPAARVRSLVTRRAPAGPISPIEQK